MAFDPYTIMFKLYYKAWAFVINAHIKFIHKIHDRYPSQ